MDYRGIASALRPRGLIPRGGFHPAVDDRVPAMSNGEPARTLVLVGHAGPSMWRAFVRSAEFRGAEYDGTEDPLDRWSARVLGALAARWRARALFAFGGPPYLPFVAWAKRAEAVAESPLGILIHPDYGLWHAYRGALIFAERIALPARGDRPRPCDTCLERPCLSACPVGAFDGEGYHVAVCIAHVSAPAGADCVSAGCRARRACPVGRAYTYGSAQAEFHMKHFLRARRRKISEA